MPYLSFDVEADYSELIRLQQEIAKTKNQLQNFRPGQSGASLDALNRKLAESTAKYRQLAQAAIRSGAEMEMGIKKSLNGIFTEVNRVQDLLTRPMMAVGGLAGVYGLGEFLTKITNIRGEFQQMNASIETLVGKRKGERLNAELQEFAKVSPLEFAPTVQMAQQMLGFGIEADKVPKYLQAIGDIAMGDTQRFKSLTLAFSQMSAAGKLMGQDLMQMVNAGFQPLQVISEKTGKSIGALKEEMSQGKITAEMVQKAFVDAASEGGKYYNMSLTASKTIPGAIAKLNDAMDLMFNDMGQNMQGTLVSIIDAASTIVDNIGRIIPVLATAAAAFGVYKTSVLLSSFAAKQSVISASKDIVDGFDAELKKIQELQNAKLMKGYDNDIRKALENGSIDKTYADAIQRGRIWQLEQQRIAENERKIAEEAQQTYETHLKDMQILREQSGRGLDSDLNDANFNGMITGDLAERLQNERDYAQALVDTKDAALKSANLQKAASDQLVESAQRRVESAKELMEIAEAAGDAEDRRAAAEEYMAAIEEHAAAITAQQSAAESVNTAERELNSAVTAQQAIQTQTATTAIIGETTATNTNTTATNVNTAATNRGAIMTALATAKDKALTVGKYALTAATDACKNAWNSLKVAFATNPIGLIITALTTAVGLFMTFRKESDSTTREVERFGESAVKTKRNVDTLFAVLDSVDSKSKVYRDSLDELTKIAKDYGIVIDTEKDTLDQLIEKRGILNDLILKEGEARQIANRIATYQEDKKGYIDDFIKDMTESIEDASKGEAEDNAGRFAQMIADKVERDLQDAKNGTIKGLVDQWNELEKELKNLQKNVEYDESGKVSADYYPKIEALRKEISQTQTAIAEAANKEAKGFAEAMGMSKEYQLDIKDTAKFVKDLTDKITITDEFIKKTQENAKEVNKELDAMKAPAPDFSAVDMDVSNLVKNFKDFKKQLDTIDKKEVKPTVDSSEVDKATENATEAGEKVNDLDNSSATPKTDTSQIDAATESANTASGAMAVLDKTSAEPVIKTTWLDGFTTKVNDAWIGLQKLLGVDSPEPLIKSNATNPQPAKKTESQKAQQAITDIKSEFKKKVANAKTTNEMAEIRKGISELMKDLEQNGKDYKYFDGLLKALDKKDKSKNKDKGKDDPKQRAYELRKAQLEEEKRTNELLLEEQNRQYQLQLDMRRDSSDKEIDVIKFEAKKKREALLKERQKEADRLKDFDRDQWLKGAKDRKAYQWKPTKSDGEYLAQAGQNIGYATQLSAIDVNEENRLMEVQKEIADAMLGYLKDFGTFQQKRFAIEQEYAEKIANARNEGERLSFEAQKKADEQKLDLDAIKRQIDWGSMFGDFGTMLSDQVKPTIERLEAITKSDEFRNSSFEEQKAVFELISTLKGSITEWDNNIYSTLGNAVAAYQKAIRENTEAVEAESAARQIAEEKARRLREIEEKNRIARVNGTQVDIDAENKARRESEDAIKNLGEAAQYTQQTTTDLANAQQNLSEATTTTTNMFSQLVSGLQGLASGSLQGVWNGMNQLSKLFSGNDNLANKMGTTLIKGVQKLFGEDSNVGQEVSKALSALGGPMMGEIVGMFFSILDLLKDGVGNFIASLIDTVLGAVNGLLNSVLSGEIVTSVGKSIIQGVGNILDTVSFGGFSSLMNKLGISGESDKNLEKDIERLTATNEALRKAVDNLATEMREAATADMGSLYQQQKADIEKSMKNTQEMMARSGAAYSNGFLGVGGHKSSNHKINKGMNSSDWSRISQIVGKTVKSAGDFWNLTSEQMAKIAQSAPDLYAKIKDLANDGYKDAAQFMDEYIEYYKELEQLESAFRESLTDVSFDSVKDDFKSLLLDMESDSKDFASNWEKMMQQAVVNSLMNSKYNDLLKKWYNGFADAMNDDNGLTSEEQANLKKEWDSIVNSAIADRDSLKKAMGWDTGNAYSQEASRIGVTTISEDTGLAIVGRVTAVQEAVEAIKANQTVSELTLADLTDELIQIAMEYSRFNVHYDNIERQLAKIYIELQTISENTGAIVKPIQTMQADIAEIKKNTKNL